MAQPTETLVFVARLTREEKDTIYRQKTAFPGSNVQAQLLAAVDDVCLDRLTRADGCLKVAKQLRQAGDEESLRASVSRGYYSAHHSIRAMALWHNHWDPDGHEESIRKLKRLLSDNAFLGRSGLAPDMVSHIIEARTNRHVADYSPYAVQRTPPEVRANQTITQNNWGDAANFNIQLAEQFLAAAVKVVGS